MNFFSKLFGFNNDCAAVEKQEDNVWQKLLQSEIESRAIMRKVDENINRTFDEIRWKRIFEKIAKDKREKTSKRIKNPKSIWIKNRAFKD